MATVTPTQLKDKDGKDLFPVTTAHAIRYKNTTYGDALDATNANIGDLTTLQTTDKLSLVGAINENTGGLNDIKSKIDNGIVLTPAVSLGMNNVIRKTDNIISFPKFTVKGKDYTNLLGRDGNCEELYKWSPWQCTCVLDSTNKVFGSNGYKITLTSTVGNIAKNHSNVGFITGRYYLISAYLKNGNATNIHLNDTVTITDTSKFTRVGLKYLSSDTDPAYVYVGLNGTSGQYGYCDGIMVNEISVDEYNTLTEAQLLDKYPYGNSYVCLENPYIEVRHDNLVRNGNGEEGVGWWRNWKTGNSLQIENGRFKADNIAQWTGYSQIVKVKKNTNYRIVGNLTGFGLVVYNISISTWLGNNGNYFNTGDNEEVIILIQNEQSSPITGYFDHIHLVEGTTAPTSYKPCRIERCVLEGKFADSDTVEYRDGKASGLLNWKHPSPLYGKDYDWVYYYDYVGYKQLCIQKLANKALNGSQIVIKPNGNICRNVTDWNAGADQVELNYDGSGDFLITVSDTDSGFTETIAPNNDEVKSWMNGWKATANNGTRYTTWVSVVDGTTVPTSQTIDYVKANVAQNYIGYELHYRLQNPEPITDVNTHIHGDIPKLDNGDNYLYLDYGMVLGEVANPVLYSTTSYYINSTWEGLCASILKNRAENIKDVYRNNINESAKWAHQSDLFNYGNEAIYILTSNFDTNATYTVDYQILKSMHTSPTSITMAYSQSILNTIDDLAEGVEGKQNHDSTLDNIIDRSIYEEIGILRLTGRGLGFGSNDYRVLCQVFYTPKKCIPVIQGAFTTAQYFNGTTWTPFPIMSDLFMIIVNIASNTAVVRVSYTGSDATIKTNIMNYGVDYNIKLTIDCRGRL